MWHDIETNDDLLNFQIIAKTAASLITESENEPLSIGVSGNWGTGKSSLLKMIESQLNSINKDNNYVFLTFNAWLYQGYDDAKIALVQKVADLLLKEAENRKSAIEIAKEFVGRVNWLKLAKFSAPAISAMLTGGADGGAIGTFMASLTNLFSKESAELKHDELIALKDQFKSISPDLAKILQAKQDVSVPQEIEDMRSLFRDLLEELNIKLIVFVDDLDRCLPETAISTLEAMRLLLFMQRTAFVIAADEQMIRSAVKSHFNNADLDGDIVTSYFDKLIQVPLRVPRLGGNEVKAYIILLLAERACKQGKISKEEKIKGKNEILTIINKSWEGGLNRQKIEIAFDDSAKSISTEIDIADQLANIMTTSKYIQGNPRLIKRFLNNLIIRETIAKAQGMTVEFGELAKIQLLERCVSNSAFEKFASEVAKSDNGKLKIIKEAEFKIAKGEEYISPVEELNSDFFHEWLTLYPPLGNTDLRPLMYLSRDKAISIGNLDELSKEAQDIYEAILVASKLHFVKKEIEKLDNIEAEKILNRLIRNARSKQYELDAISQAGFIVKCFPNLAQHFCELLDEIPYDKVSPALPSIIKNEQWANKILEKWSKAEGYDKLNRAAKTAKGVK